MIALDRDTVPPGPAPETIPCPPPVASEAPEGHTIGRLVIGGGPSTGKTTLANKLGGVPGVVLRSTDDLIATHAWSEASEEAARWFDEPGCWVIEGCAVPRSLRKWLAAHPGNERPCDRIVWLRRPLVARTRGQDSLAKGCETVWSGILPELRRRGVAISEL